ncbi:MAG: DUF2723 domain-containing protein [candidate division Zixibacteria bacterium]|nr:DUF2723 domain-containing protein [candidate division Zixibacteria bacterium]
MNNPFKGSANGFDRTNALIAVVTGFIAYIIFRMTVSPTISYWDCGEFLACAHIMGNPHPPGSPLFIIIGRFFDILHLVKDVAFRINLVSVFSSSFATLFAYLIIVRLVTSWYVNSEHYATGRIIAYASGVVGALFMAFGRTNWGNSVEAEVYSLAMMIMLAIFWLAMVWRDTHYTPKGQRIAILVAFLATLSVGLHLTVFLVVPIVAIIFCLKENATKTDWFVLTGYVIFEVLLVMIMAGDFARYKIYLALTGLLTLGLLYFLRQKIYWPVAFAFAAMIPIISDFYSFMFAMIGLLIVTTVVWLVKRQMLWQVAMLMVIAGSIGWSVNVFVPIRSTQHPLIDENTPSRSFKTFVDFLDRKQYGTMSMTERMFVRRGSWANQLGDHARMGYWNFFKEQYSKSSVFPVLFLIGLFGLGKLAFKHPAWGAMFIVFVFIASVGLVVYMNFADGTQFNEATGDAYQEVRDRDYFFTPAFMLFGMAIGLGMGAIMETVRKATEKLAPQKQRLAIYASLILVLTPIIPAQANYFANDRSKNYQAYDYAFNMLSSCQKDAILFTSGDNDTFPLWAIQGVYGFRTDVRVVNFSLLNTDWYNWQLKHYQNVPISLADDQILWNPYTLPDGQVIPKPDKPFFDRARNRQMFMIPMPLDGQTVKVASMMLDEIILTNRWKYPIYFSSAAGEMRNSPLKLLDRCYREGLILRLSPDDARMAFDELSTDNLFYNVYQFRNLDDTLVSQDENATGIALGYPEKVLDYHTYLMRKGETDRATSLLEYFCKKIPYYWRLRLTQMDMYRKQGDSLKAIAAKDNLLAYLHGFLNKNPGNIFFYQFLGLVYYTTGDRVLAEQYLNEAWAMNHDKEPTFRALLALYAEQRRASDMIRVAKEYKDYQENDQMANEVIRSADMLMKQPPPDEPGESAVPATPEPAVRVVPQDPGGGQ